MYIHGKNKYFDFTHRRMEAPPKFDFHLHDRFEIYFFIAGNVHYLIDKNVYPLSYGDMLILNNRELHKPTFRSNAPYENVVIHFDPSIAAGLALVSDFPLLDCFVNRPQGESNRIALSGPRLDAVLALFKKAELLLSEPQDGADLLLTACMIELLVLVNQAFRDHRSGTGYSPAVTHEKLGPLLEYIDGHLEHDLTLEALERQFYMNRYYLSRLFRKHTGSTIHEYILLKRIARAKKLLQEGHNVTAACEGSGFNDYSHFIRMFKRFVGVPPGQYRKR
ncbi:helix-turn-helix domain-containing protein [Paenibacillus oleatilyticus]|uniref:Helix-turn-helix domain-containing protein n=1 Tax=Paenibacillus oleatilyticus TaxID=2594886 RepID=A0ABV4V2T4_9BACL